MHNTLAVAATLHGLQERPADTRDAVTVDAGATYEVRFAAGDPGTYLYWARTPDGQRGAGSLGPRLVQGCGNLRRRHQDRRPAAHRVQDQTERLTLQLVKRSKDVAMST